MSLKIVVRRLLLASCAAIAIGSTAGAPARAEDLKKVSLALGDQLRVSYYWLYVPTVMGYLKQEGLTLDVYPVGGSVEALQQIVSGHAQFAQMGADTVIEANAKEKIPAQVAVLNGVFQWKLGMLASEGIKRVEDLKGKSIGVYNLTSNGNLFLKIYLRQHGIDPDHDVSFTPVGYGGPPLHALQTGAVAALYYWPSAFTGYELQGTKFDYISSPDWAQYPDYVTATLKSVVDKDPAMVQGFARAVVKGIVFTEANPECAVRLFWKAYPDARSADMSEAEAMTHDLALLKAQMAEYAPAPSVFGAENVGAVNAKGMGALQDFLAQAGAISDKTDPAALLVQLPDFFAKANDFDKAAIQAQAKACKL